MADSKQPKKPLTDEQLAAKYDNGGVVDFDAALMKMKEADSKTSKNKARNPPNKMPMNR